MLSITKLQNLKAIHNGSTQLVLSNCVVINHKTTKFESNSQRDMMDEVKTYSCYQSQNYKIWKQFTTCYLLKPRWRWLLSITKLQNLKAIHNLLLCEPSKNPVVINHKTTKFESNSQQVRFKYFSLFCCYQSQNYKIWKQFTTRPSLIISPLWLLSITKLQNLKAIHNRFIKLKNRGLVVINHKTTKFESNSQP